MVSSSTVCLARALLDLFNSCGMPGGDGDELDALLTARLPGLVVQLSVVCNFQTSAGLPIAVTTVINSFRGPARGFSLFITAMSGQ